MTQLLRALPVLGSIPENPHGSSPPTVMISGALFWPAGYLEAEYGIHNK